MLDPKATYISREIRARHQRPVPALHRRSGRGSHRATSCSARIGSPASSGVIRASPPTCSASPCSKRPATSPAVPSPTTSPSLPSDAPDLTSDPRDRPADSASAVGASRPAGQPRARRRPSWRRRTSCSSAIGSTCCSTRARSSRTACWPTPLAADLPADGVVTGIGTVDGRPVCVMANDPTVKAGSWGARTVEKIVRLTERALRDELPVFWLVDSAGARITDQVELFPGRRGRRPDLLQPGAAVGPGAADLLPVRPSAAGGAYIPAFCDMVIMVEGNASMYLGSPRMAEMVIGEIATLEEMGGARMHATVSGCGDNLADRRRRRHRPGPGLLLLPPDSLARRPADLPRPTQPIRAADRRRSCRPRRRRATTCTTSSTGWSTPRASSRSSRCSPRS